MTLISDFGSSGFWRTNFKFRLKGWKEVKRIQKKMTSFFQFNQFVDKFHWPQFV